MESTAPKALVHSDADESQWLSRHLAGDPTAFESLVHAYKKPIYGFLARCPISAAERDDLFQEIFLKIHRSAHQYDPQRPLKPWIFTIVANTARTYLARRKTAEPIPESLEDGRPSSEQVAETRDQKHRLNLLLKKLPDPQRWVLLLHCCEDITLPDVAETLNMPLGTVKTHLRRGRLALVQIWQRATLGGQS